MKRLFNFLLIGFLLLASLLVIMKMQACTRLNQIEKSTTPIMGSLK